MNDYVYVCYEENYNSLAFENGPIDEIRVFRTSESAYNWFLNRVDEAIAYGFVIDKEDTKTCYGFILCEELYKEIENGYSSLTVFKGRHENWDLSYAICVKKCKI